MQRLSKKAVDRIVAGIKRFQPILASAKARDVNESDTVIIVTACSKRYSVTINSQRLRRST